MNVDLRSFAVRAASWSAALLLVLVPAVALSADRVEGQAVGARGGEGIPFVRVGVSGLDVDTIGDENGNYVLELPPGEIAEPVDVVFDAPGFRARRVRLAELSESGRVELVPKPGSFQHQVIVSTEAGGRTEIVGKELTPRGFAVGFAGGRIGSQVGARIPIRERSYVESAHFIITRTGGERFLYRVNLYEFRDGKVGENLLSESVIVDAPQVVGAIDVELGHHLVVVEDDVLLTLEWVKDDSGGTEPPLMFRARQVSRSRLYHKRTVQSEFEKMTQRKLVPGFYLKVVPLEE